MVALLSEDCKLPRGSDPHPGLLKCPVHVGDSPVTRGTANPNYIWQLGPGAQEEGRELRLKISSIRFSEALCENP